MIPKLASISVRAAMEQPTAELAWHAAAPHPQARPWAKVVDVPFTDCYGRYASQCVVGQGDDGRYFTVFPFPFEGHSDDWHVVLPINKAEDLLKQIG